MILSLKKKFVVVIVPVLLFLFGVYSWSDSYSTGEFETQVYKVNNGYGYNIRTLNGEIIIKQDYIPAIQYKKVFSSREDAKKVAFAVAEKLKSKENPKISISELKIMGIK
jgi:hypothetical protein